MREALLVHKFFHKHISLHPVLFLAELPFDKSDCRFIEALVIGTHYKAVPKLLLSLIGANRCDDLAGNHYISGRGLSQITSTDHVILASNNTKAIYRACISKRHINMAMDQCLSAVLLVDVFN